jgi:hypothetical protein
VFVPKQYLSLHAPATARPHIRSASISWMLALAAVFVCSEFAQAQPAAQMTATIYDDGLACPADCDAHVAFADKYSGTRNAFAPPLATRSQPRQCSLNKACIVCFSEGDADCIEVTYRGRGPHDGRFDFTPAFYASKCDIPDIPKALIAECKQLKAHITSYSGRINCFVSSDREPCRSIMSTAKAARDADAVERSACLSEGEAQYNARQTDPSKRRSLGCNYEFTGTGRNSRGQTWRKLLPASCRVGTFVGTYGTDCCYGNLYAAAAFDPECRIFFPREAVTQPIR